MPMTFPSGLQQVLVCAVGCCVGSFFNVVIHRLPSGLSIVRPGSRCPHCGHAIAPYDNIPLLSYVILGGRCRACRARIGLRYPLVEALTGAAALLLFLRYGWQGQFLIDFTLVSLLILITFIDLDTYLIPDVLSLPGIAIGFLASFFSVRVNWLESLLGILLGGGFFYLVAAAYQVARKREGLGGGDIKLLAMVGAFVGWPGAVFTVLAASVLGTVAGLVVMMRTRKGLGTMIPFGPFLAAGTSLYLAVGEGFFGWYMGMVLD